jgi:tetratricopeptide (TPR) repeat protein
VAYFNDSDIGLVVSSNNREFALAGEELWAPTGEGVIHYDGKRWQIYKEAAADEEASIVAGGGEVWLIDSTGKFSHYLHGKWESEHLVLPGVKPEESETPKLARTDNGTVWLAWQGLWRRDGAAWTRVTESGHLIGAAGDRVWLFDAAGLRVISMDGRHQDSYTSAQTGAAFDVASAGGRTWFATANGLLEFDGSAWRTLPPAGKQTAGYRRVAIGPAGALWVVAMPSPQSMQFYRKMLPVTLFLPIAIIALVFWIFRGARQRRVRQHQMVTSAVHHATGEIPEELRKGEQTLKMGGWYTVIMLGGCAVGGTLLYRLWPSAPVWTYPLLVLVIHLAITFQKSLIKRTPQAWDPIGPGAPSRYDWGKTGKTVAGAALVILLLNADRFPQLSFLRGWMFWVLILGASFYQVIMASLLSPALQSGNYDRALNIVRWLNFYNPSGMEALRKTGYLLLFAGRHREAEDTLRRSLASAQARTSYASALEYLGDALMEQGRYDEAMRSYEAAVYAFPWWRRAYRGMAETLLRQGKKPEQALEWIEKIVDFAGLSYAQRKQNGRPQDDYWALKAWALARLGRRSEVPDAIEKALQATNKKVLPDLAATYYRAGMAMQAISNDAAAREYLTRGADLDPRPARDACQSGDAGRSQRVGEDRLARCCVCCN